MDSWRWLSQPADPSWWCSMLVTGLLSALLVWLSLLYANRRDLVDRPGARRSHTLVTARGGGVGIVVAVLMCAFLPLILASQSGSFESRLGSSGAVALALVAGIGWIDDHRSLGARIRIAAHFAAALSFLFCIFVPADLYSALPPWVQALPGSVAIGLIGALIVLIAIVWSINLHNFMDGINGLLTCQAIFVFAALAALSIADHAALASWFLLLAAATLGFLPFNFPRARIFMGDVGSGALGFLVAVCALLAFRQSSSFGLSALMLSSAFVVDATSTLLSRMVRGRRWYSAHREHLYQWLARSGFSHAGVVAIFMGWNFIVVAPVLYCARRSAAIGDTAPLTMPCLPLLLTGALYAFAGTVWFAGKRWCIWAAKHRHRPKGSIS